jgi:hypothetical protein
LTPRFRTLPHLVGEALQKDAACNCTATVMLYISPSVLPAEGPVRRCVSPLTGSPWALALMHHHGTSGHICPHQHIGLVYIFIYDHRRSSHGTVHQTAPPTERPQNCSVGYVRIWRDSMTGIGQIYDEPVSRLTCL